MERSNLFEALAKYDYKTMIQLYAEEGMDSLRSMHNWIHIQQNISCSAEEKLDESLHFGQRNKLHWRDRNNESSVSSSSSSSLSTITSCIEELQKIVQETKKSNQSRNQNDNDDDITTTIRGDAKKSTNTTTSTTTTRHNLLEPRRRMRNATITDEESLPYLPLLAPPQSSSSSSSSSNSVGNNIQLKKLRNLTFRRHFETRRNTNSNTTTIPELIDQEELEEIMYERVRTYTNAPPEASFTVNHRREYDDNDSPITTTTTTDPNINNDSVTTTSSEDLTIFDGAVAIGTPIANTQVRGSGGGSGTIQHLACALDSPFGLALVLAMEADVSSRHTTFRRSILHEAACCNSPNCLRLLLELGKGIDSVTNNNQSMLSASSSNNERCLSGCQQPQEEGMMMMMMYTKKNNCFDGDFIHPEKRQKSSNCLTDLSSKESKPLSKKKKNITFTSLLKLGMDLITQMKEGKITELEAARALLSKATISDVNKEIISVICRVDIQNESQRMPSQSYPHFISFLRDTSLSLSNTDGHGNTALHWAAFKNSASCIKLLIEYNADPDATADSTGWRPLHDAAYSDSSDAISILVKAGADVNSKANSGATPLCFAAQEDSPNATKLLLEAGADPCLRCDIPSISNEESTNESHPFLVQQSRFSGYTPLHYCAHYNSCKAAIVLLEHSTKFKRDCLFDIIDVNNKVPIHIVAERGSSDVLREFLHNGVQINCTGGKSENHANIATVADDIDGQNQEMLVDEVENDEIRDEEMQGNVNNIEAPSSPLRSQSITTNPISSPILRSLIPSEPRNSPKPWNCLTQNSIDECKLLLKEAEGAWDPSRHYIFTPYDRAAIFEVMKVAGRLNHVPQEIWLFILKFCGRGWFDSDNLTIENNES